MPDRRTLVLRTERLTELGTAELADVVGGQAATKLCLSEMVDNCYSSDYVATLCGCLTQYCSVNAC